MSAVLEEGNGDVNRFALFSLGLNTRLRHGFTRDSKVLGVVRMGFGDNESECGKNKADD